MIEHPKCIKQKRATSVVGLIVSNVRTFRVDDLTKFKGLTLMLGNINTSSDSAWRGMSSMKDSIMSGSTETPWTQTSPAAMIRNCLDIMARVIMGHSGIITIISPGHHCSSSSSLTVITLVSSWCFSHDWTPLLSRPTLSLSPACALTGNKYPRWELWTHWTHNIWSAHLT